MKRQFEQELAFISKKGWLEPKALARLAAWAGEKKKSPLEELCEQGVFKGDLLPRFRESIKLELASLGKEILFDQENTPVDHDKTMVKPRSDLQLSEDDDTHELPDYNRDTQASADHEETMAAIDRNRFHIMGRLGKGGMGIVYKAYDYHLERNVAIKVLISRDSESVTRFIREARAQACVDHEHICKVFEVGQTGRNPYIVMQYIDGTKLNHACEAMTLEQRLLVMKQIAYGVHEAHRMGLIHRDLKPSNIMVLRTEDGRFRPFVLDFGLAKFGFSPRTTMTGGVIGTPAFMAPEQAMGLYEQLDRRTDVYALGATMYCILTGKVPIKGESGGEVLANLQNSGPIPPRKVHPEIPKDVEIITMKCMARNPGNRYQSARAFAEDLGRYLDGDPIHAKPLRLGYRIRKKLLKHKAIVVLATLAVLLAMGFFTYMLNTRWQMREQERLATAFTERVEEVEAISRLTYLSRRHDIRSDRARLNRGIVAIREEMRHAGKVGESLGHYALGKAHLVLGELAVAEQYLEKAWSRGYQAPRVAHALGMALGERYRHGLEEVQLLPDRVDRDRRKRELEQTYLKRARLLIQAGSGTEGESPVYLEALLAYYDGRFNAALRMLDEDLDAPAWFYEALKLKGDIYRDRATQRSESGNSVVAKADFDMALQAYAAARVIGESDPRIYRSRGKAFLQMMMMGVFSKEDLRPYLDQGLREVHWALEVLPDDRDTWLLKAQLHRNMAQQLKVLARDPLDQLQQAEEAAICALQLNGQASPIRLELGQIYWRWAQWQNEKRLKPDEKIDLALRNLEQVDGQDQTFNYFHTLGTIEITRANALVRSGGEARGAYERAISVFRNAIDLAPEQFGIYNSLAVCLFRLSEQPGIERPPFQLLQEGIDALKMAIQINPNHVVLHYQMGRTYFRMAQNGKPLVGNLNDDLVEKALGHYQRALEINPKMLHLYNVLGMVHYFRGIYAWEAGQAPKPWFDQALSIYAEGLALAPSSRRIHQNMGWVHYYSGKFKLRQGQDPSADFRRAEARLRQAMRQGKDLEALLGLASVARLRAEGALLNGEDFRAYRQMAAKGFEDILATNPNYAEAHRSLGRLYTLAARHQSQKGQDPTHDFELGRQALDEALALEVASPYFYLADARWYLHKAIWLLAQERPAMASIQAGLMSTEKALRLRPEFAEAKIAAAAFDRLASEARLEPQGEHEQKALAAILAAHPHLNHEWAGLLFQFK